MLCLYALVPRSVPFHSQAHGACVIAYWKSSGGSARHSASMPALPLNLMKPTSMSLSRAITASPARSPCLVHAHKRGRSARRPNPEQICVLSGVNDSGTAFFELAGRGSISRQRAMSTLKDKVKDGSIISTDRAVAYPSVLHELNVAVHNRFDSVPHRKPLIAQGTINRINAVHANLKLFMKRFRGVTTKHLHAYLDWQRWRMDFARDMATANTTVAAQLSKGTYQTMRSGFFNRPQLHMDYWRRG